MKFYISRSCEHVEKKSDDRFDGVSLRGSFRRYKWSSRLDVHALVSCHRWMIPVK